MDPVTLTAGGAAALMGCVTVWLALGNQDLRAQLRAGEEDLHTMARELRGAQVAANDLRRQTSSLSLAVGERTQASQAAAEEARALGAALEAAERGRRHEAQRVEALERSLEHARADLGRAREVRASLDEERRQHEALRQQLKALELAHERARAALQRLCPEALEPVADPLSPERRAASRHVLAELLADTGARAACLTDARGLPGLSAGVALRVERAAALAALFPALARAAATPLGAEAETLRLRTPQHEAALQALRPGLMLAVDAEQELSPLAMQRAALRLMGLPEAAGLPPRRVRPPAPRPGASALEEHACAWRARWGAHAVLVLDGAAAPLASTTPNQDEDLTALALAARPLLDRMERDGWPPDLVDLDVGSTNGEVLHLRAVRSAGETLSVLISAPHPMTDPALDELLGAVRWHGSSTPRRAAG